MGPIETPNPIEELLDDAPRSTRASKRAANRMVMRRFRQRSPWTTVLQVLGAAILLFAVGNELYADHLDRQLTDGIRQISGRQDLDVHCRRVWDEAAKPQAVHGYVEWGDTRAYVALPICRDALRFADDPTDPDARIGLMVVTHELAHLVGHHNEAQTECVAMWAAPDLAEALGGSRADALAATAWYEATQNPKLPGEYRTSGCLSSGRPSSPLLG